MDAHPPGTTYCLAAGTFEVASTITTGDGDRIFGAGRDATFIDGRPIPATNGRIFIVRGRAMFADLDISGARTPPDSSTTCINASGAPGPTSCGKALVNWGELTLLNVNCHDNGANCIGGDGDLVIDKLDCWNNGSRYSMSQGMAYAGCIKVVAVYTSGDGSLTLTNSYIHDQPGNGVWCDYCKYGIWDIHDNVFERNGNRAIQWEMSGGWNGNLDRAHVYRNTFIDNGWNTAKSQRGGINISTANDILVENNTFSGQAANGAYAIYILFSGGRNPPQPDARGVVVRNNTLNGDAIVGCGRLPLATGLYLERTRLVVSLLLLTAIVPLGVLLRRRFGRRPGLLLGLGAALCVPLVLNFALLLARAGATCQ